MNARLGPACNNYHLWQARIKKALDPHTASDPFFYAEPEPGGEAPGNPGGPAAGPDR